MRRKFISLLVLFLLLVQSGVCMAYTAEVIPTLTVERAIQLALEYNEEIQAAELNLDAAQVSEDIAWHNEADMINASYIPETDSYYGEGIDTSTLLTMEYNLETAQKNYDTKTESVKFGVYQKYYAVVTALDSWDAQQLAAQQSAEKHKIAELRYLLGMDTKLSLYQSQQQDSSSQANLVVTKQALDQKYIALMEYIGMASTSRPTLVRELTYTPLNLAYPEQKFEEIVNKSPNVYLAEESLELTEDTAGTSGSDEMDDINLEKSDLSIITAKENMLQATRSIYYNILSVEESYNTALQSAKSADEALRVARLMYEVGLGIKLDVTAAELAAKTAHQTLDSLSYQHTILLMAFEKPWAYGSL